MSDRDMLISVNAGASEEAPEKPSGGRGRRFLRWALIILVALVILAAVAALVFFSTGYGYTRPSQAYISAHTLSSGDVPPLPETGKPMKLADAEKILQKVAPKGVFVVIDHVRNRLHLRDGDKDILDAVISAGAGSELEDPKHKRKWIFDTPSGRFYVKGKRENPTWTAPDWDYIESGEPIPKRYSDRVQEGMLGEYALDLGGGPPGYMIHGTLYTRLLGRNVSHGCIRVGRDDLRIVWKKVPVGSTVFMY